MLSPRVRVPLREKGVVRVDGNSLPFCTFRAVRRAVLAHRSIEGTREKSPPQVTYGDSCSSFALLMVSPNVFFSVPHRGAHPCLFSFTAPIPRGSFVGFGGSPDSGVLFEAPVSPPARVRVLSRPPSRAPLPSPPLTTSPLTTWSSPPWRGGFSLPPWQLVGSTMSPQ